MPYPPRRADSRRTSLLLRAEQTRPMCIPGRSRNDIAIRPCLPMRPRPIGRTVGRRCLLSDRDEPSGTNLPLEHRMPRRPPLDQLQRPTQLGPLKSSQPIDRPRRCSEGRAQSSDWPAAIEDFIRDVLFHRATRATRAFLATDRNAPGGEPNAPASFSTVSLPALVLTPPSSTAIVERDTPAIPASPVCVRFLASRNRRNVVPSLPFLSPMGTM